MPGRGPAPGLLEVVRSFVNTYDIEDAAESLRTPDDLAEWLADNGLTGPAAGATSGHLASALSIREALRTLILANSGDQTVDVRAASGVLDDAARAAGVTLRFSPDGALLEPGEEGIDGGLGRVLIAVAGAMGDGTWTRLKACREDTCGWVFFDHSKNRSSTWCSMGVCGNRAKARSYRARRAGSQA